MIDFSQVSTVAVDFMNDDHKIVTEIVNRLMVMLEQARAGEQKKDEIGAALTELLAHCREHFAREEAQMQHFSFPPYPIHKGEHERVLAEMENELTTWQTHEDLERLYHYVFTTLPAWLVEHVETLDTVTAMFIVRSGGPV